MNMKSNALWGKALDIYKINFKDIDSIELDAGLKELLDSGISCLENNIYLTSFLSRVGIDITGKGAQVASESEYNVNEFNISDFTSNIGDAKFQLEQSLKFTLSILKLCKANEYGDIEVIVSLTDPAICPPMPLDEDFSVDDEPDCNLRFYKKREGVPPFLDNLDDFEHEAIVCISN